MDRSSRVRIAWLAAMVACCCAQNATQSGLNLWSTGPLLAAVQNANLSADSKTFVDMPIKASPENVTAAFAALPTSANGTIPRAALVNFVQQYFDSAGNDLEVYSAPDFQPQPPGFLSNVNDSTIHKWGLDVHGLWGILTRKENASVVDHPERHSLLSIPGWVAIPGDRFREVYYWDSYWIVLGLLVSNMPETAKSEVNNLVSLLNTYGHVPNGARSYYINRSQPPLLSKMVAAVYNATDDKDFLANAYQALQKEHVYWTSAPKQVTVEGASGMQYNLSRYYANWTLPRPESFRQDTKTAAGLSPEDAAALWNNLASGAETGWDFSSRWFAGYQNGNLTTVRTTNIIPADLNAYLYDMERNLAAFAAELGDAAASASYAGYADVRRAAINDVMWDASAGHWTDLVIARLSPAGVAQVTPSTGMFVSNYIPLWVGIADAGSQQAANATASFLASGLLQPAGVATTLYATGQQWDFPNVWPPLEHIMIEAMQNYGGAQGGQLARQMAQAYLASNYIGFQQTGGKMVEKFSAVHPGVAGAGGEYNVQTGFGWTNGVMLSLLNTYGWNPSLAPVPLSPAARAAAAAVPAQAPIPAQAAPAAAPSIIAAQG
ncbi:hypothetical protein WJX72_011737 [[Myrmecia] bisecta]|uniref:Trehalase n=1 Tax=[Myrmecia] bisecta TaxID=41462 RepID=A0AAW1R9G9_9CHLO